MPPGLLYRHPYLYETGMRLLYGSTYLERFELVAERILPDSTVVDVCSGPGTLFRRFLRPKGCRYLALDVNRRFLGQVTRDGGEVMRCDVRVLGSLPPADHVTMLGSLYHFLPDAGTVLERMLDAARRTVILCEPVRNVTHSSIAVLRSLALCLTDPGTGRASYRFTPETLEQLVSRYTILESTAIPGGRDQIVVLRGRARVDDP